mgnify:FL=1
MRLFNRTSQSELVISDDVIAKIAASAVEVDGFGSFSHKAPDFKSHPVPQKAVKVLSLDNDIRIQVYINVKDGYNVQTVSAAIQRAIKNSVQSMTGKVVGKVNVCIQGIDF